MFGLLQYPTQLCRLALLYVWTRECEQGINDLKYDRKAIQATAKRFAQSMSRLPSLLNRGAWKASDEAMMPVHKNRLEAIITVRAVTNPMSRAINPLVVLPSIPWFVPSTPWFRAINPRVCAINPMARAINPMVRAATNLTAGVTTNPTMCSNTTVTVREAVIHMASTAAHD